MDKTALIVATASVTLHAILAQPLPRRSDGSVDRPSPEGQVARAFEMAEEIVSKFEAEAAAHA